MWVPCPGSVVMQELYPKTEDGAGDEGGIAHDLAAVILDPNHLAPDCLITDEMQAAVDLYVSGIRSFSRDKKVHVEVPVQIPFVHADCWGTLDARWYDTTNDILHIFDLKDGWGIVEAFRNWQMILYALGVLEEIKATNVWLHIIQPRPFHSEGPHRIWKTTTAELNELGIKAIDSAFKALGSGPPLQSGPHCRYCSALWTCNTARAAGMNAVDISGKGISPESSPGQIGFELKLLRRAKEMIDHRLTALEQTALSLDKSGTNIPGWSRSFTAGRNVWQSGREVEIRSMAEMYGVTVDKQTLITPAQATKAGLPAEVVTMYSEKNPGKAKMEPINQDKIKNLLGGNVS